MQIFIFASWLAKSEFSVDTDTMSFYTSIARLK